jgi:hypothetical protein
MRRTNDNVTILMDAFLGKINLEKRAAEGIEDIKADSGKPQTEEVDKPGGNGQGAAGTEKRDDLAKGMNGSTVPAESPEAAVKPGDGNRPTDDQGTKTLNADEKVKQDTVSVKTTEDPAEDNDVNDKGQTGGHDVASEKQALVRNAYLGSRVLDELEKLYVAPAQQKTAASNLNQRLASVNNRQRMQDYAEAVYRSEFEKGAAQFESDVNELKRVGIPEEQAVQILTKIAMEDPEAIAMPSPEAAEAALAEAPMGGPVPADGDAELQEMAAALAEAGVTEEQLVQAAQIASELEQANVSPEEVAAAVEQMAAEDDGAAREAVAAYQGRINVIKDYLRGSR